MCNKQPVSEDALRENIVDGEEDSLDINVDLQSQSSRSEGTSPCQYTVKRTLSFEGNLHWVQELDKQHDTR